MNDNLAIYQLNAQSADKLDERRDATTRSYGGMCIAVATAATGTVQAYPVVSSVLWAFLVVIALSWLATIASVTAKLTAKNSLLIEMERNGKVPAGFLIQERERWERLEKTPLQNAVRKAPTAFVSLGGCGLLTVLLVYVVCPLLCR